MSISREAALAALDRLARRLAGRGVRGHVHIVGGAAMMLRFGASSIADDVDAFMAPAVVLSGASHPDDRLPARTTAVLEGLLGGARPAPFAEGQDRSPWSNATRRTRHPLRGAATRPPSP